MVTGVTTYTSEKHLLRGYVRRTHTRLEKFLISWLIRPLAGRAKQTDQTLGEYAVER
jgi:hypothetical protein